MVLPSGFTSTIEKIDTADGEIEEAFSPMSVTILLADDIDISRGDMIVREHNFPDTSQNIDIRICWFHEKPLQLRGKYEIRHTTQTARCIVQDIQYKMDVNTLHRNLDDKVVRMNDIARISVRTTKPLFVDSYSKNRITGSVILVDEGTNETVAAGMVI